MSDPMNKPPPPPEESPRKGPSPLIWILILIALIAFGWYFYNQRTMPDGTAEGLTPPPATSDAMTPAESSSAEEEPDTAKATRPEPSARAPAPRSREVALIEQPQPEYPPEAARAREQGTVLVEAQVDAMGNVSDVDIAKRSGSRVLDRAAMREVRRWKFRPAMEDGKAVASSIQVPVDYRLEEESQ